MYRILTYSGHSYQFDNADDADRFVGQHADARELTAAEIEAAFGDNARHVGPHNTTVDAEGVITFGYALPPQAPAVRAERDRRIEAIAWRVERYLSETRLGLTPTDDITAIDAYIQALRDVPDQAGFPAAVTWPELAEA